MEDLLSKTSELASLVSSLQQQDEDNSDLRGIVAQLEAAVAKRASLQSGALQLPLPETKIEPTDPVEDEPVEHAEVAVGGT